MAPPTSGPNSSKPTTGQPVAGVYNAAGETLVDGQATPLQVDVNGNLLVNVAVGGGGASSNVNIADVNGHPSALSNPLPVELSDGTNAVGTSGNPLSVNVITGGGSNASVGVTGTTAPTSATEIGIIDGTGKLQGASATNPVPITGSISATNPSVGTTGATAPTSATEIGVIDGSGNLRGASLTNPVRIDPTGTTTQPVSLPVGQAVELLDSAGTNKASISAAGAIKVDGSAVTQPVSGTVTATQATGTNLHVVVDSAPTTAVTLPAGQAVELLDSGGTNKASISAAGAVKVDGSAVTQPVSGTVTANQGTAAASTAGWPTTNGNIVESTAAWTSATAVNSTVQLNTIGYSAITVTLNQGTTITGGIVTFEVSDTTAFTNAYTIQATPINSNPISATITTFTLVANTNSSFVFNVSGWAAFRVRLSTVISGTATVNVGVAASSGTDAARRVVTETNLTNFSNNGVPITISVASDGLSLSRFVSTGGGSFPGSVGVFLTNGTPGTTNTILERTPAVFKTAQATASGTTTLWTPTSGKKFRLMRFMIQITGNATTAGGAVVTVSFLDQASAINIALDAFVPSTAFSAGEDFISPWVDLGMGFLSAAANNTLFVNLSAALTAGNVRVTCCGTEE
jgi:hypothetical protein